MFSRFRGPGAFARVFLLSVLLLLPRAAWACACGCGVFDVATSALLPASPGGTAYLEYDFMNQGENWNGTHKAPAANNTDKDIRTDFMTAGAQYMFNRDWGVMGELPYWNRHFVTATNGPVQDFNHAAIGDVRLHGVYTGFSPDMTTGATFGVKLPTGDWRYANFDRDTQIGSGSTDLLLGGFHRDRLSARWTWFVNAQLDVPVLTQGGYRPGSEADAMAGLYFSGWKLGRLKISPIAQLIGSWRLSDRGTAADPSNSGYKRVFVSPGLEFDLGRFRFNAEADLPVYQNVTGNQLVAPILVKFVLSRSF
jgi:hypothetical protein